jgi:Zn-dependent M28 family amino/carboxypeptidase
MPGRSFRGSAPPAERQLVDELRADVSHLAGTIGERNLIAAPQAFDDAARWIEESFRRAGYQPDVDEAGNVVAEIRGGNEIVVIGAHYDTVPGSPGADDNGSGVAALLAIARRFARERPARTLRFVAFANEEPPYFMSEQMGSWIYAKGCHDRRERVVAMMSIESIGYYSDAPGSQQYPAMLEAVYPTTANFIAFASNLASRALLQRSIDVFRRHATVPSEGGALPEDIPGIGWSDQWSFWRFGYPAFMVTDTALFRNRHYHQRSDLPDTLDYERLARVTDGLMAVVRSLATP